MTIKLNNFSKVLDYNQNLSSYFPPFHVLVYSLLCAIALSISTRAYDCLCFHVNLHLIIT